MDFSSETIEAKSKWTCIYKVLKGKNSQPRILYPENMSLRTEEKKKDISK